MDVVASARAWIAGDPDAQTRAELEALIAADDHAELAERMAGSLEFGTAGLRGAVAAGSNRMNRAVVIRTTRGLADYLLGRFPDSEQPVVVGGDARPSTPRFVRDTVAVLAAAGIPVRFFADPTPTPLIAYAARRLEALAAVAVTASHNPPADNGYKVYDANAAQIVPPVDADIASAIAAAGPAKTVPRLRSAMDDGEIAIPVPSDLFDRYLAEVEAVRAVPPGSAPRPSIVHTPIHGVGGRFVVQALAGAGYHEVVAVADQFEPDGRFPTVAFPNPEEPGALDHALALAGEVGADVILANDPDTDRLAVALRFGGVWRPLTGNQVGVLLADYVLEHTAVEAPIVINSIVSSPMLADIAAAHRAGFAQALTGFKWIWNAALDLQAAGAGRFVFGYEEALGYCVGPVVRDKDGIGAAVAFADLMTWAAADGVTVWDRLAGLYRRHGLWVSVPHNLVRPGTEGGAEIAAAMERLAAAPPERLGDHEVVGVTDYRRGADERPRYLPATSLVALDLGAAGRVLVRPSGTEPKLKIYVDLRAEVAPGDDVWQREAQQRAAASAIGDETAATLGLV